MGTLLDLASLVMIPSGYKEDVVYSVKPTDGSGDLDFTRSNDTATRVNSAGLIEKVRTNTLTQSGTFSNAAWTKGNITLTAGQTDPNGGTNAFLATSTGTSAVWLYQANTGAKTFSIYAKAGTKNFFSIINGTYNNGAGFNLSDQTVTNVGAGSLAKIESVGSGWYRCSVFVSSALEMLVMLADTSGGSMIIGDTMSFAFAQAELGDIATDYIPTTSAAVSVGMTANVPRLDYTGGGCPKLLLEPQTTALNEFSESFDNAYWQLKTDVTISANTTDTLDPSGYYGAEKITETATTARHRIASNVINLSAVNHTASVFMKKGTARYGFVTFAAGTIYTIIVDLEDGTITDTSTNGTIVAQKVEDYGNGWYRISVTGLSGVSGASQYNIQFGSAGSATPSYTAHIPFSAGSTSNYLYAWGANLTATSYLQSYIPTLGAAVTRGADAASKTGISSLINSTEGVLYAKIAFKTKTETSLISINDGTTANSIYLGYSSASNVIRSVIFSGGVASANLLSVSDIETGEFYKIAVKYKLNDFALYVNGVEVATDLSGITPIGLDTVEFDLASILPFIGDCQELIVFPTALTNTQLAELTTI